MKDDLKQKIRDKLKEKRRQERNPAEKKEGEMDLAPQSGDTPPAA
jgi:hypothetical protein